MADEKRNPLIGAFRAPVADKPPDTAAPAKPDEVKKPVEPVLISAKGNVVSTGAEAPAKPGEDKKPTEQSKAPADSKTKATGADTTAPAKPGEDKKPIEQTKAPAEDKAKTAGADTAAPAKPDEVKKPVEPVPISAKGNVVSIGAAAPAKPGEDKKPTEQTKAPADSKGKAAGADTAAPAKPGEDKKPAEQNKAPADSKGKAAGADTAAPAKPGEDKKPAEQNKAPADSKAKTAGADTAAPAKPGEEKKPTEKAKTPADSKAKAAGADAAAPAKPGEDKKPAEQDKAPADSKAKAAGADAAAPAKPGEDKKPAEQDKAAPEGTAKAAGDAGPEKPDEAKKDPNLRFVKLSEIVPLPGTYVKDEPRADYKDLIDSIKKSGLEKPVILRRGEKGEFQLVDGFHRCKAVEQAGMLEIRAEVYEMPIAEATRYRREHRQKPDLPIPGKLVPLQPAGPEKADESKTATEPAKAADAGAAPAAPAAEEELPKNLKIPLTKEGEPEAVTTMRIADIHKFVDHPYKVQDDKDMWDLVESIKQFGVLEPAVVIPRKEGGYEMVSGHRRQRACQLAGLETMPVIIRQLDRDEATISMVDANLKRENISPMEKARAYTMKLEAMKRKTGRRSKMEILSGKKPMRADEQLAQQTGESRSTIQRLTRLTKLEPEFQQMVDDKKLPLSTAEDISHLKKEEQRQLVEAIEKEGGKVPSGTQAAALKEESKKGTLTQEKIEKTVAPTKREESISLKVEFTDAELRPYFPEKTTTPGQAKRAMFEALDLRAKALVRQAEKAKESAKTKKSEPPRGR